MNDEYLSFYLFLDEDRGVYVHKPEQSQLLLLKTKFSCFHGRSSPEVDMGAVFLGCVLCAILIDKRELE